MKRYLMLFIVLVPGLCFASLSFDATVGYKENAQMEGNLDLGLSLALDDNTYTLLTRGGEYLSLQYERNGDFSSRFSYLYGAVANIYGEDAVSLLVDGLCSFSYGSRNVNLSLGFGAQGGIVKYRSLDNFFFSLPTCISVKNTISLLSETMVFASRNGFDEKWRPLSGRRQETRRRQKIKGRAIFLIFHLSRKHRPWLQSSG